MNPASQSSWTPCEKFQVILVGVAPTFAIALAGLAAATVFGPEAFFVAFFALPLAYGTLFLSVFPALSVVRRFGPDTLPRFVLTVSAATFTPWAFLTAVYLLITPPQEHPPASLVALALAAPTLGAAVAAFAVWLLGFRGQHAA